MNNNLRIKEEKESNTNFVGMIIAIILFAIFVAGLITTIIIVGGNNHNDDQSQIIENQYNKLLSILNNKINETKVVDTESVNSITTFMYKEHKFHIVGYNELFVYDLSLFINDYNDEVSAYNYVVNESTTTYVLDYIDRYDLSSSIEFNNKYLTSGYTYKAVISTLGMTTNAYMTRLDNNTKDISVICGDNLSSTLSNTYTLKTINQSHQLYSIYNRIVKQA